MSEFEPTVSDQELPQPISAPEVSPGMALVASAYEDIVREMQKAVVGQTDLIDLLIVALLANGHVLLEGVPGIAKTLAVRTFAAICSVDFHRIQFTPDLMPSDILGTSVYDPEQGRFNLKKGPIFAGIVLADEINRTPPKTQSALLEAMEERRVTIDGVGHPLPEPFLVCATQNPVEYEGTYPLPEAQLDRFMLKIVIDYPSEDQELNILQRYQTGFKASDLNTAGIQSAIDAERLLALRAEVEKVQVTPAVQKYIVDIARSARNNPRLMLGPSPRAAVTLMLASKALAAIRGRDFVTPDDVKELAVPTLRHRILLKTESEIEGYTTDRVMSTILQSVEVPR